MEFLGNIRRELACFIDSVYMSIFYCVASKQD